MAAGFRSSSRPGQVWAPEIKHDDLGNLVIGPPNPRAVECKEVYLGADHTILVSRDGDVYSCGRGDSGQLGHGALSHHFEPTRIDAVLHDKIVRVATAGACYCNSSVIQHDEGVSHRGRSGFACIASSVLQHGGCYDILTQLR